jgi:hypothetical protein
LTAGDDGSSTLEKGGEGTQATFDVRFNIQLGELGGGEGRRGEGRRWEGRGGEGGEEMREGRDIRKELERCCYGVGEEERGC